MGLGRTASKDNVFLEQKKKALKNIFHSRCMNWLRFKLEAESIFFHSAEPVDASLVQQAPEHHFKGPLAALGLQHWVLAS